MRHSPETHFLLCMCVTRISWLDGIIACHRWAKAHNSRYGRDIIGSARWQRQLQHCSPTFVFSIWGHPRIPHSLIKERGPSSCRRKTNNGKRTRKRTRLIRFKRGNAIEIRNGIMFELPHFIQISTTLLTRFPRCRKRSILPAVPKTSRSCN